jgi:hypothetical protein
VATITDERYFVTFTDDATRFIWTFLLKSRAEITERYIEVETYLKTQFDFTVKKVHGDDAAEHKPLAQYLQGKGVIWDPTPEVENRYLVEPLVAIMAEYHLPKYLWGFLLKGVNYTMNRLVHSRIDMTPYEALFGKKPDLSHLRALG